MTSKNSLLKFYRDLRVPIDQESGVDLNIEALSETRQRKGPIFEDVSLFNASTSGLGFESYFEFQLTQKVFVHIKFKKETYSFLGEIVRKETSREIPLYGVRLDIQAKENALSFMKSYTAQLSNKKLRALLCELLFENNSNLLPGKEDQLSIVSSLFTEFHMYSNISNFKEIILNELTRILNCEYVNLFHIDHEKHQLQMLYPGKANNLFKLKGKYIDSIYQESQTIFDTFPAGSCDDPFYKSIEDLYGADISQVLAVPIKDHKGNIVGHLEAINKREGELFEIEDENILKLVSLMMNFFIKEVRQYAVNESKSDQLDINKRKFAIVGQTLAAGEIRTFIRENKDDIYNISLIGEYGTGKSILAKVIHFEGPLGKMSCGEEDCTEITSKNELVNIFKGDENKVGKFELYSGGSLILKNIHNLNLELQACLYELLEKQKDIRIIVTSTRDLQKMALEGEFNKDLYSLCSIKELKLRPLRERTDDIPQLIEYFTKKECEKRGFLLKSFSPEIVECFKAYEWKENIEELRVAVERAVLYNMSSHQIKELPFDVTPWFDIHHAQISTYRKYMRNNVEELKQLPIEDQVNLFEFLLIEQKLNEFSGDITKASKVVGINEDEVHAIISKGQELVEILTHSKAG